MNYTRKSLNVITLVSTILVFIILYFIYDNISILVIKAYYQNSNIIYSKTIPIQKSKEITSDVSKASKVKNLQTQRQMIQANKANPWRIQIPKLGLDVHIEEGTNDEILLQAVGHFTETNKWNGNVGLAGHNRGHLCNFFQKIKNLKIGDEIIYHTTKGKRVYKVQTNKVILETDWTYLQETEDNRITLITCEENRGEYRRCIQAVQILECLQ